MRCRHTPQSRPLTRSRCRQLSVQPLSSGRCNVQITQLVISLLQNGGVAGRSAAAVRAGGGGGGGVVPQTCSVWCAPVASHAEAMVAWLRRRHRTVIRPRSPRVVTATTALAPPMMAASAAVRVVGVALMVMGMPQVSAS